MADINSKTWRLSPLPRDWKKIRLVILEYAGYRCQNIRVNGQRCQNRATDVDHIGAHDDHSNANLQALCHICHARKTQLEAEEAKKKRYRREPEIHPFYR
jgi:hypothetical protein